MNIIKTFISSVIGGMCISIGGCAFLASESKAVGAVFFVVGLFTICTFGFYLFTGKVCYVLENDRRYAAQLPIIWLGNLIGCLVFGGLLRLTRLTLLMEKANSICDTKLSDGLLSVCILAVFCNILIYIAVDGYKNNPHEIGKYLSLLFGVAVFVLCGFEHCVANMFYITAAGRWSGHAIVFLLVNTLGNAAGGILIPALKKLMTKKPESETIKQKSEITKSEAADFGGGQKNNKINETQALENLTDQWIDRIAEEKGIIHSEERINSETDDLVAGYLQRMKYAAMGNGSMRDLTSLNMEEIRAQARAQAIHELNEDIILNDIIKTESIAATAEELEQEATRIAKEQNSDLEMIKRFFGEDYSGLVKDVQKHKARKRIYEMVQMMK